MESNKKKVLIADDSKTFLMYTSLLLKRMGFYTISAGTGVDAIKLSKLMSPDAMLLDINMPELDGIKTLKHIKDDNHTSHIPVIMVSVDSKEEVINRCKNLGCCDYLTKPLKIDRLNETLQSNLYKSYGRPRKYLRSAFSKKVIIQNKDSEMKMFAENLSEKGIFLRSRDHLPVGSEVNVALPLSDKNNINLKGVVIYTKAIFTGDTLKTPGLGIEFKDLTNNESDVLKNYISNLLAGDIFKHQEEPVIHIDNEMNTP